MIVDIIPLVIIVIILALVIIYVTRPLFTAQTENDDVPAEDSKALFHAQYDALLDRIRELDFDANLDKLSPQEYDDQREELMNQAAAILREIQAQDNPQPPSAG